MNSLKIIGSLCVSLFSNISVLAGIGVSCGSVFAAPAPISVAVPLAFDYDFVTNQVAGVRLYYGASTNIPGWDGTNIVSFNYTNFVFLSAPATNGVITNLSWGVTYYFAATAITTNGIESDYSNEVMTNIPVKPGPILKLLTQ
jgi:hypothetical protein